MIGENTKRRTILDCSTCREVVSAPEVEPEEGLLICPNCETVLDESDWVPAADYYRAEAAWVECRVSSCRHTRRHHRDGTGKCGVCGCAFMLEAPEPAPGDTDD